MADNETYTFSAALRPKSPVPALIINGEVQADSYTTAEATVIAYFKRYYELDATIVSLSKMI